MKFTFRIWLLLIFISLSLLSIFVNSSGITFLQEGIKVDSINQESRLFEQGLKQGDIIISINNQEIDSSEEYYNLISQYGEESEKIILKTQQQEIVALVNGSAFSSIAVSELPSTRLNTGLDLQGGTRAIIRPEQRLTEQELNDLISVSEQRLNVYGLTDAKFYKVTTSDGENLMGVEIAGSTNQEIEELVAQQGKFEAKIGNQTVFTGGEKDITHVGRTGQDAMITDCFEVQGGHACNFRFVIYLSEQAAQRHADITSNLSLNQTNPQYLEKRITFYVDDKETSSLNIGADLRGNVATQIQISGSESAETREQALDATKNEMKKLQTILITGSLPYKLEIAKIDRISPKLGQEFGQQILLASIFAILAVSLIVFIRYRKIKISAALIAVSLSEVLIILGVASLISWNLDLASIAGIIAAIGTGIDSQLIIIDESHERSESIKQRIKKALFIIVTAFTTTFVALVPLTGWLSFMGIGAVSAGLLKGFALTTMIGITTGVLISRPAFADIARQMEE